MIVHETEGGVFVPLNIKSHIICKPDKALENIRHALSLPYPWVNGVAPPKVKPISVCGAAPSLADTYNDLCGDVMATNSAIPWLHDRGVTVDYAMMFDAHPGMVKFARRIKGCRYYLASRCDPAVFEALRGEDIVLWHALGDIGLVEMLEEMELPPEKRVECVMGGSTAVTRGIYLAPALGYHDIHIYGADSSMKDGETHVAGSLVDEEDIEVMFRGKKYRTTPWLAKQAKEFHVCIAPLVAAGCKITVHGEGLLPDIWRWMKSGHSGTSKPADAAAC